jgi:hypothetical protein
MLRAPARYMPTEMDSRYTDVPRERMPSDTWTVDHRGMYSRRVSAMSSGVSAHQRAVFVRQSTTDRCQGPSQARNASLHGMLMLPMILTELLRAHCLP